MDQFEVLRSDTLSSDHHEREFRNLTSGTFPDFDGGASYLVKHVGEKKYVGKEFFAC